jgi:hypothetical protein
MIGVDTDGLRSMSASSRFPGDDLTECQRLTHLIGSARTDKTDGKQPKQKRSSLLVEGDDLCLLPPVFFLLHTFDEVIF